MELKSTRKEFTLEDESGYSFEVIAEYDPEWGWNAHVTVSARGFNTDEGAISALRESVKRLLSMLPKEAE